MGAAHLSPRRKERLEANSVATVRSALVPGLIPRDLSAASQVSKPSVIPSGSGAAVKRVAPVRRLATDRLGGAQAKFAHDMRVRHRGEKRQIDGERRPAGVALPPAGRRQRRQAERENVLVSRDVLPRDAIAIRRLRHRLAQRRRGRGVHVMPRRASEAARIGGGDRGEDVLSIRPIETIEHPRQRRAQSRVRRLRGRRERRAQEDNAEIGVLLDRRRESPRRRRGRGFQPARPSPRSEQRSPRRCE